MANTFKVGTFRFCAPVRRYPLCIIDFFQGSCSAKPARIHFSERHLGLRNGNTFHFQVEIFSSYFTNCSLFVLHTLTLSNLKRSPNV
jgi:hypothetical protein